MVSIEENTPAVLRMLVDRSGADGIRLESEGMLV